MTYKFTPAGFEAIQDNINISNNATIHGLVTMDANVASNTTTDGTLVVTGGVGISGKINAQNANVVTTLTVGNYSPIASYSSQVAFKFPGGTSQYGIAMQPINDGTKALSIFNAANTYLGGINQTSNNITFVGDVSGNIVAGNTLQSVIGDANAYTSTSNTVNYPKGTSVIVLNNAGQGTGGNGFAGIVFQTVTNIGGFGMNYVGSVNDSTSTFNSSFVVGIRNASPGYTEHMRINGQGQVGFGTTSPAVAVQIGGDTNYRELRLKRSGDHTNGQALSFNKTRGTEGAPTVVSAGDTLGSISFTGHDGNSSVHTGAFIQATAAAGTGNGFLPTNLAFITSNPDSNVTTSTITRMLIASDGNVGVGTTAPAAKLHVGNTGNNNISTVLVTSGEPDFKIIARQGVTGVNTVVGSIGVTHAAGADNAMIKFIRGGTTTGSQIAFTSNNDTESMRINASGNVAIGTTTAYAKLEVRNDAANTMADVLTLRNNGTLADGNTGSRLNFGAYRDTNSASIGGSIKFLSVPGSINGNLAHGGHLIFSTTTDGATAPNDRMWISNTGNVGVGILPTAKLHVVDANATMKFSDISNGFATLDITTTDTTAGGGAIITTNGNATYKTSLVSYTPTNSSVFFGANSAGYGALLHESGTGLMIGTLANVSTIFGTSNVERMRLTSDGYVLVGTSTKTDVSGSSRLLQVVGNAATGSGMSVIRHSADALQPVIALSKSRGTASTAVTSVANNDTLGSIRFSGADGTNHNTIAAEIAVQVDGTPNTGQMPGRIAIFTANNSAVTERMRIDSSGITTLYSTQPSANVSTGALVVNGGVGIAGNAHVGGSVVSTGIKFSGLSTDANTLDAYEEGTFTPTVIGTTTAGAGTYNIQVGRYTRIGNRVFFTVHLGWIAHTGTGNMQVSGLPITSNGASNSYYSLSSYHHLLTLTANNVLQTYIGPNSNVINLQQVPIGGGSSTTVAIDAAVTNLMITGHYDI